MILPCFIVAACAMRNPAPPTEPAAWEPPPAPAVAEAPVEAAEPAAQTPATETPATPKPVDAPQAGTPAAGAAAPLQDVVIATVAGRSIFASELISQWLYAGRSEAREQIDNLVMARMIVAEATRLGVRVDEEYAEKIYARNLEALEKQLRGSKKLPETITLDRYITQYLGLDPQRYREHLRDDSLRAVLGERVVRGWLLQNEHAFLRVIVVKTEEDKKLVEDALAAGTTFEDVAKQYSKDASAQEGGRIAPIVRSSTPIAAVAFATEPGKVGGPIAEGGDFLFVRVEKRGAPREGAWDVLGPAVEQSLGEQGLDNLELEQWRRAMGRRYTVDIAPFFRLAGEPANPPR